MIFVIGEFGRYLIFGRLSALPSHAPVRFHQLESLGLEQLLRNVAILRGLNVENGYVKSQSMRHGSSQEFAANSFAPM